MIINFIFMLENILCAQKFFERRYVEEFSMISPHVASNGRAPHLEFLNDFLIKTKSKNNYTQLGYKHENSFGMIKFIKSLNFRDFNLEIDFSVSDIEKGGRGAGFGFWIDPNPINAAKSYGKGSFIDGFGVVLDIDKEPTLKFLDNVGPKGSSVQYKNDNYQSILIEKRKTKITVKLMRLGKPIIIYDGSVKVPADSYFYITSFSGKAKTTLEINRIVFNKVNAINNTVYVQGEKRKYHFPILIFGGVCIGGLVYYLNYKKEKSFHMKS